MNTDAKRYDLLQELAALIAAEVIKQMGHKAADPVVLSTQEAAEFAHTSPAFIRGLIARGELPAVRNGRVMRVLKSDLADWLERQRA